MNSGLTKLFCRHSSFNCSALRTETSQARYTNRQLDPYPLYGLAELFDTIGREVRTGQLNPRNPIRQSAVALASKFCRTIDTTP